MFTYTIQHFLFLHSYIFLSLFLVPWLFTIVTWGVHIYIFLILFLYSPLGQWGCEHHLVFSTPSAFTSHLFVISILFLLSCLRDKKHVVSIIFHLKMLFKLRILYMMKFPLTHLVAAVPNPDSFPTFIEITLPSSLMYNFQLFFYVLLCLYTYIFLENMKFECLLFLQFCNLFLYYSIACFLHLTVYFRYLYSLLNMELIQVFPCYGKYNVRVGSCFSTDKYLVHFHCFLLLQSLL